MLRIVRVVVRGGGDLGSGVVYRLYRAGFTVMVTELSAPLFVRRTVAYGAAVYDQRVTVEGVTAQLVQGRAGVIRVLAEGSVPVIVDPEGAVLRAFKPSVVIDARMEKQPLDATPFDAPLVIGLGPGFEVGIHCHAVVETNRGHNLGRVLWRGGAEPDTGTPGEIGGVTARRVLRAPAAGQVKPYKTIGTFVAEGEIVAEVDGVPVPALQAGVVRGLIHPTVKVDFGMKIGDIDPRARPENCFLISEKALAVGGGVVEAILSAEIIRTLLDPEREGVDRGPD